MCPSLYRTEHFLTGRKGLESCGPATQWKTGRTTKTGINGKNVENLPRSKMGKKWPKNTEKMENRANFPFFRYFSAIFFPFSIGASFPRFSHFFPIFVVRPVFHCVAGPHDCKRRAKRRREKGRTGWPAKRAKRKKGRVRTNQVI